ncbi:DUF167 domain-containing protein [Candidatus Dojkabacteria bacterium]|uniref:DUF167 domain-containing protein n=1 Tax=Candidatus Dojkabacteria bacterium TaxID=2099670 RepID=A0A955LAH8_9BACT|nr:DUF167 domain-containing protein [Candidatus Dojkabacteria bacterium]
MIISTFIKPNSKKGPKIEKQLDGSFIIYTRNPAIENKANEDIIKQLARYFEVNKNQVKLLRGAKSKLKIYEIN